jgi:hypothetical protein
MKIRQVADWHAIQLHVGMYPIAARTVDEAVTRMKRFKPGVTPHTCLWHPVTDVINRYYFLVEKEVEK